MERKVKNGDADKVFCRMHFSWMFSDTSVSGDVIIAVYKISDEQEKLTH